MRNRLPVLRTERLLMKPLEEKDRQTVTALLCSEEIGKTYMLPELKTVEQKAELFDRLRRLSEDRSFFAYGIFLQDVPVGFLHECGREGGSVELGYFISPDHWNRGYATEALRAAIGELFRMGFCTVEAAHFPENPASGRVMQKCGMHATGRVQTVVYRGDTRVCVYYAIERTDDSKRAGE